MIRGVLIQSCSAGAKNFTNYVYCHPQFSGVIQNIAYHCAIKTKFWKTDFYYIKLIILIIIDIDKQDQNGTTIFNNLDNTTELWMTKYIIGEIFSSGGATLYKNPSDQSVCSGEYAHFKIQVEKCWETSPDTKTEFRRILQGSFCFFQKYY